MNAITQYMDVLKAENDNLLSAAIFFAILFFIVIIVSIFLKDKLDDIIRSLKQELQSIKVERDQLQLDNIQLRKQNNEAELSKLKKQLEFALKHPPKFPVGTKITTNGSISEIEIKFPGYKEYAGFAMIFLISGIGAAIKSGLPKPYYIYKLKSDTCGTRELLEHQIEELKTSNKSKPTKKPTKKPRKNGNKKTGKAGIKKS